MLGSKDPVIGPARRLPERRVIALLGGGIALVLIAGIAIWWAMSAPRKPLVTRIEVTLPPAPSDAPAPAPEATPENPLIERGASGPLPRIAEDGRQPWQVYARPFDRGIHRPRIAVVIAGLGQSAAQTEAAISKLPGAVTLAFSPYARDLPTWFEKAHAAEHEMILQVPMEPIDFPREDPGPATLLTTLTAEQNLERLEWTMSRAIGYVGVTNFMGSRFAASPDALQPILEVIKGRGLLLLETRTSNQSQIAALGDELSVPRATDDRNLDGDLTRAGIEQALGELEQIARRRDGAIGVGSAFPITIERVAAWAETLDGKGLVLAPLSAMVVAKPQPPKETPKEGAAEPGKAAPKGASQDAKADPKKDPKAESKKDAKKEPAE